MTNEPAALALPVETALPTAIARAIATHETFLIASHVGPDGDAIGSGLALQLALTALGKKAWMVAADGVPVSCRFLPNWQSVVHTPPRQPQCAIVIDCDGTPDRVAAPYAYIQKAPFKILIDHHRTARPIFDINWIDPAQPATALMIFNLLRELNVELTPDIAQCLLCGLSTDTGNFRFSNTSPEALLAASELVRAGANIAEVAFKLFEERTFAATKLLGLALQKMQDDCDGQLMWAALGADDFKQSGVGDEGTENVVNFLRNVRGARMAIVLRERADETGPVTRISVRSEADLRSDLFCQQFGGGGHVVAAGCRIRHRPFEESIRTVIEAARRWIEQEHPALT